MSNLEIIDSIIDERYKCLDQSKLIEEDSYGRGQKFKMSYDIVKRKSSGIDYKLYRFEVNCFPFFKEITDLKKMCDYIMFIEYEELLSIFLIELKRSNMSAYRQLDSAECFAKFIVDSSIRIGRTINLNQIKKIRICEHNTKKSKQKFDKEFMFNSNMFCDYKFEKFYIQQLLEA